MLSVLSSNEPGKLAIDNNLSQVSNLSRALWRYELSEHLLFILLIGSDSVFFVSVY